MAGFGTAVSKVLKMLSDWLRYASKRPGEACKLVSLVVPGTTKQLCNSCRALYTCVGYHSDRQPKEAGSNARYAPPSVLGLKRSWH